MIFPEKSESGGLLININNKCMDIEAGYDAPFVVKMPFTRCFQR